MDETLDVDDAEEDVKCPPHFVPSLNLNEECASHKPATSHQHKHHRHYKHEHQDSEAVAMEEGVPFEEKEKFEGAINPKNLVAEQGIGIEYADTSGGQHTVSPSRRPDVSPGAAALGTRVHHPTEGRRHRIPERGFPGAFREGGIDNEEDREDEEDERTIESHTQPPIPPTVSAELVDAEEEERHRQDDINQAVQKERQMVQDQINQALQREREQAVVAEVIPEVISKRDRRWKFAGAFLLLVLIVVGVVLGITLRPDTTPGPVIPQDLITLLSSASSDSGQALRTPSTSQNKALEWLAGNANLAHYTSQEKIQRYALATLYYSTKGDSWTRDDFWVSDADVCDKWYAYVYKVNETTIDCSAGAVSTLSLHDNKLSGAIPPEIGMLSDSLVALYLSLNELNGTLPNEIAFLTKLTSLSLTTNILKGTIPSVIGLLTNLEGFTLGANELEGTIPSEIGRLTKLEKLYLDQNKFTGTIPTTLGSLILLEHIFLRFNELEGPIPTELAHCQNLKKVPFEKNTLTGDVATIINMLPRSLTALDLDTNRFTGTVPTSIGTFTELDWLDLADNNLHGTIPSELGLLSKLELLYLYSNRLTGTVPTSLASLSLLKELILFDNDLTGSLDAFCGKNFEMFVANTCGAEIEIECQCCNFTHCCDNATYCEDLL